MVALFFKIIVFTIGWHIGEEYSKDSGIWILMSPSLINGGLNFKDLNILEDLISGMAYGI